jgi:hypothetical protein
LYPYPPLCRVKGADPPLAEWGAKRLDEIKDFMKIEDF